MPRWKPNARMRLVDAALDLFEERGYDDTSVREIAERAGLTKTTFFRQFADKREVLSAGQEEHTALLSEAISAAPASATPLRLTEAALIALARTFPPERRAYAARVHAVTASHPELSERAGLKHAGYVDAMRDALVARDVPEPTAGVAAELGSLAFRNAFRRWTESKDGTVLEDLVRVAVDEVFAAGASLGAPA